ncbi:winged helix-turn-helix domain-containing protein [Streptosporangium sp. NPDC002524]|uniref:winged helix-turn-helix domain-containing protein n=1 Tax=Streptosporangium sp. NPDC002524 TaxID=3154537 RepID=UPI003322255B
MRALAPELMPIFRSRLQARLLARLFLAADEESTITDLAEVLGSPLPTVQREVHRLVRAGLLRERKIGRARLVRANTETAASRPLAQLLAVTFGPPAIISEEFASVPEIERLVIFGSWAARYHGRPGPQPNDVDLLVVGSPSRGDVYDAAERAERRLGISVNPVLRSVSAWESGGEGLLREIANGPTVVVEVEREPGSAVDHRRSRDPQAS